MTDTPHAYQTAIDQLRAERDAAFAQLETVTAERDHLAAKLGSNWIEREVDARLMADLETGPVAFERNQLRDEVAELRAQLKAQSGGLNKHWQEQVRLAKAEGRRRARNLASMLHAHVNAIAGEEP